MQESHEPGTETHLRGRRLDQALSSVRSHCYPTFFRSIPLIYFVYFDYRLFEGNATLARSIPKIYRPSEFGPMVCGCHWSCCNRIT